MELNREQIITALECCVTDSCFSCPYDDVGVYSQCVPALLKDALALINSQEQRIQELETESERLKAWTVEALTEFAESVKRYYSALPGATVGAAVRFYVDEKLKEALDKI